MIDYWKKNLEFSVYYHPYKNRELSNYKIRDIEIIHRERYINISFKKKDAILGIGIFWIKSQQISLEFRLDLTFFVCENDECEEINLEILEIESKIFNSTSENFSLIIFSNSYNLELEQTTIVHYNLDDEYEDFALEEII